jgi:hypothetical protein
LSPARAQRLSRLIALDVEPLWDCPDLVWWWLVSGDEGTREEVVAVTAPAWNVTTWSAITVAINAVFFASVWSGINAVWSGINAVWSALAWNSANDDIGNRYLNWLVRFGWEV